MKARRYNMGESLWVVFCGNSVCSSKIGKICSSRFLAIICPCSCLNHILVISIDIILLFFLLFIFIYKASAMKILFPQQSLCFSTMLNSAAFLNGCLGLVHLGLGIWILREKLSEENTILPLHGWLVILLQGFIWFFWVYLWGWGGINSYLLQGWGSIQYLHSFMQVFYVLHLSRKLLSAVQPMWLPICMWKAVCLSSKWDMLWKILWMP